MLSMHRLYTALSLPLLLYLLWTTPIAAREGPREKKHQAHHLRMLFYTIDHAIIHHPSHIPAPNPDPILPHLTKVLPRLSSPTTRTALTQQTLALRSSTSAHEDLLQLRQEIMRLYKVPTTAAITPHYDRAKVLYNKHCAACHGPTGHGDGPLATRFPPTHKVPSFHSRPYKQHLSAHMIYNLSLLGLPSGAMVSLEEVLTSSDIWGISYYTLSLQENCSPAHAAATTDPSPKLPHLSSPPHILKQAASISYNSWQTHHATQLSSPSSATPPAPITPWIALRCLWPFTITPPSRPANR